MCSEHGAQQFPDGRLARVLRRIRDAEERYGREPGAVRLIGVGKVHTVETIRPIVRQGLRDLGENYVQEALTKQREMSDMQITWHFIGHIQSNKSQEIADNFQWVHSVDREKIARRLSVHCAQHQTNLNICLQINLQDEASKSGVSESDVAHIAEQVENLPGIALRGLMAIPRPNEDFDQQRTVFRQIRKIFEKLQADGHNLDTLSMGMSGDMEAAIAEGATMVRIGTDLFGSRPPRSTT